jgi:hypothetical protein
MKESQRALPASLVVTQSLDMNVNLLREFTNGKIIHLFSFGINLHSVPRNRTTKALPKSLFVWCGILHRLSSHRF